MTRSEEKFTIRLNREDRPFLDEEALRLMQEHFEECRELKRPSLADVVSTLLEELREHRRHAKRCPHRASPAGEDAISGRGNDAAEAADPA